MGDKGPAGESTKFFVSNGTSIVPAGVVAVVAELRGGGGSAFGPCPGAAAGGGQGGLLRVYVPVKAGDTLSVVIFASSAGFGGGSALEINGPFVATAGGGQAGSCGGGGGGFSFAAPAIAIEGTNGAAGTSTAGGGIPRSRGTAFGSGGGPPVEDGVGGYVELQLVTS